MNELLGCPFCGGSDVKLRHHHAGSMSWVSCVGCGLEAPSETGVTDEQAVEYWNRRALSAGQAQPCVKALLDHFREMQSACTDYLTPESYVARYPKDSADFNTTFPMPDKLHSEYEAARFTRRRDKAFISDIIRMLDGPEQRSAEAALSVPLPEIEGGYKGDGYQERVSTAHHALFHDDPTDVEERRARFFEEANEACQALGMTREEAIQLVDYTYDRPVGDPAKEVGAAMLTLTSLCVVADLELMACAEADLEKLQRPETIARIRAKRSTRHGRGPLPGFDAAPSASIEGETP